MVTGISQNDSSMNGVNFAAMKARREQMFAKMDTNNDGSIDKTELTSFLQQMSAAGQTAPNADDMFAKVDTDGNGQISKAEFMQGHHGNHHGKMFAKMDTNGDGSIDKAELTAFLQQMSATGQTAPNVDDVFAKMDTDGDGKISKAEFDSARSKHQANTTPTTLDLSGLGSEVSAATIPTLLSSLGDNSTNITKLFSTLLQQYGASSPVVAQSALDVSG